MKKLLSMLLCAAFLCTLCLTGVAEEDGKLILGTTLGWPPFEEVDDQGNAIGFDIDIGRLIAEKLGMELAVEDINFDGLLMALDDGKVDMVLAAMTITDERAQQVNFSAPYFEASQQVVMRKDAEPITALEQLPEKLVAAYQGTTGHLMCEEMGMVAGDKLAIFNSLADCVMELLAGRVDAVVMDTVPAPIYVAQHADELMIVEGLEIPVENYGIAIKKENTELLEKVDAALAEIMTSEEYQALLDKYFGA